MQTSPQSSLALLTAYQTVIPRLANICPRQSVQKGALFFGNCGVVFSLTLDRKSGKVNETKKRYEENQ